MGLGKNFSLGEANQRSAHHPPPPSMGQENLRKYVEMMKNMKEYVENMEEYEEVCRYIGFRTAHVGSGT